MKYNPILIFCILSSHVTVAIAEIYSILSFVFLVRIILNRDSLVMIEHCQYNGMARLFHIQK